MPNEPRGFVATLWRLAFTVLGVTFCLWLSVRLLVQIWWVLAIVAGIAALIFVLVRWWRGRNW